MQPYFIPRLFESIRSASSQRVALYILMPILSYFFFSSIQNSGIWTSATATQKSPCCGNPLHSHSNGLEESSGPKNPLAVEIHCIPIGMDWRNPQIRSQRILVCPWPSGLFRYFYSSKESEYFSRHCMHVACFLGQVHHEENKYKSKDKHLQQFPPLLGSQGDLFARPHPVRKKKTTGEELQ